jgi:hypothetical protein
MMTVNVALPPSRRDLRLDLFRGLANWAIFLGHIPNTALAWLTTRNYGFSDGADLFVFISGYTATLVFGKMMLTRGFLIGSTRLFRRAWQLYVAQVLLFVFYMTSVHYLAHKFNIPHLMDQFNVGRLMEYPREPRPHTTEASLCGGGRRTRGAQTLRRGRASPEATRAASSLKRIPEQGDPPSSPYCSTPLFWEVSRSAEDTKNLECSLP